MYRGEGERGSAGMWWWRERVSGRRSRREASDFGHATTAKKAGGEEERVQWLKREKSASGGVKAGRPHLAKR